MKPLALALMSLTVSFGNTGCRPMGTAGTLSTSDPLLCRYYATKYTTKAAFSTSPIESTWTCSYDTANNYRECTIENELLSPADVREEYDSFSDFVLETTPGITKIKRVYVNNSQVSVFSYDSATGNLVADSRGGVMAFYTAWDAARPTTGSVAVRSGTNDLCENITRSINYSAAGFVITDVFSPEEDPTHFLSVDTMRYPCKDVGTVTATYTFNSDGVLTSIDLNASNLVDAIRNIYTVDTTEMICI